jgi:uncharacterized membrane protein YkvA (DUF1232 family)
MTISEVCKNMIEKLKERARKLKSETAVLYIAFKRKETPLLAKIIISIAICYALSPIDLIPDFIPVIGFLDDVLILPFLVAIAIKLIPSHVMEESREQAKEIWKDGKPKRFVYALPVIIIWFVVIFVTIKAIW